MAIGYAKIDDIKSHIGHKIEAVYYGTKEHPVSHTIECETCGEVLIEGQFKMIDDGE